MAAFKASKEPLNIEEAKAGRKYMDFAEVGYMSPTRLKIFTATSQTYDEPKSINTRDVRVNICEEVDKLTGAVKFHVCFAGTNPKEWEDLKSDANIYPLKKYQLGGKMHCGFSEYLLKSDANGTVESQVSAYLDARKTEIKKEYTEKALPEPKFEEHLAGHSLGGAAVLAYVGFIHDTPEAKDLASITTFGAPCALDKTASKAFNKEYASITTQYINYGDPVAEALAHVPGALSHVGTVVVLYKDGQSVKLDTEGYRMASEQRLAKLNVQPAQVVVEQVKEDLKIVNQQTPEQYRLSTKDLNEKAENIAKDPAVTNALHGYVSNSTQKPSLLERFIGLDDHDRDEYKHRLDSNIERLEHGASKGTKKELKQMGEPLRTWAGHYYDKNKDQILTSGEQVKIPDPYVEKIHNEWKYDLVSRNSEWATPVDPVVLRDLKEKHKKTGLPDQ